MAEVATDNLYLVVVGAEACALVAQTVEHDEVGILLLQLTLGVSLLVVSLERECHNSLLRGLHLSECGCDVRVGRERDLHVALAALYLLFSLYCRTIVGYCRSKYGYVSRSERLGSCVVHLAARLHIHTIDCVGALQTDRTGYERNISTTAATLLGDSEAHLAA